MTIAVFRKKWIALASICCVFILTFYSWSWIFGNDYTSLKEIASNPANISAIDSGIHILQQGDIVVRTGNDFTSTMFCKMNQTDKTYSHCGIVMLENGYPYVYHSIGGEDNPNEVLRRDSASFWFSPAHNTGFGILRFSFTQPQADSLKQITLRYYHARKKFDMDFDLKDDNKLYCAELVYKAMNYAMNDTAFIQPSYWMGKEYVAVDNITLNSHAHLICQVKYK